MARTSWKSDSPSKASIFARQRAGEKMKRLEHEEKAAIAQSQKAAQESGGLIKSTSGLVGSIVSLIPGWGQYAGPAITAAGQFTGELVEGSGAGDAIGSATEAISKIPTDDDDEDDDDKEYGKYAELLKKRNFPDTGGEIPDVPSVELDMPSFSSGAPRSYSLFDDEYELSSKLTPL